MGLTLWLCAFTSGEAAETALPCAPERTDQGISYGDIIDCRLEDGNDNDFFRFDANAGDIVFINLLKRNMSGSERPVFLLFDPDNLRVHPFELTSAEFTLRKTGRYAVEVSEQGRDQPVDYTLRAERVFPPSPTAQAIFTGIPLRDAIDGPLDFDQFCFSPNQPGTVIQIRVGQAVSDRLPEFLLYDPAGRLHPFFLTSFERGLVQAGPHTVLVAERGFDQSVDYTLNLECINENCQISPCGVVVPDARLTLIKEVINDDGRNAQPNDFRLTVNNNPVVSGAPNSLPVNTPLVINETPLPGYDFVRITGAGCPPALGGSVVLNAGSNLTCTVTNDDRVIDPTPPGPPAAPDRATEPLDLSNPRPSGCTFSGGEITCAETPGTPSSIAFDTNIPGDARFLQFEFSFEGADGQALGTESLGAAGGSADDSTQRINGGDLGAVFISNVPIAALPGSSALPGGGFRSSGQFRLPASGTTTATVTNFPSGAPGSVFRIRNLRIDRCREICFGKRPTICGTNARDELLGTRESDVIVGRGGNDKIDGRGGKDRICGGAGNDRLLGGKGDDRLSGGAGKDRLAGGAGRDTLDGGLGRDTCDDGAGEDRARRCDKKGRVR